MGVGILFCSVDCTLIRVSLVVLRGLVWFIWLGLGQRLRQRINLCWSPYVRVLHQRWSLVHRRHGASSPVRRHGVRGRGHRGHIVLRRSGRAHGQNPGNYDFGGSALDWGLHKYSGWWSIFGRWWIRRREKRREEWEMCLDSVINATIRWYLVHTRGRNILN